MTFEEEWQEKARKAREEGNVEEAIYAERMVKALRPPTRWHRFWTSPWVTVGGKRVGIALAIIAAVMAVMVWVARDANSRHCPDGYVYEERTEGTGRFSYDVSECVPE